MNIPTAGFKTMIGPDPVTVPQEWATSRGALWGLGFAAFMRDEGYAEVASAEVERIAAWLARPSSAAEGPDRVGLPDAERGRSEHDLAQLDRINARLARGYKKDRGKTADEQREADLRARAEIENRSLTKAEDKARAAAISETIEQATARGEQVTSDRSGVNRILDHDPLAGLSWLTDEQWAAAQTLRQCYEMRGQDAGAVEFTGMPGSGHDHERFVANRFTRAKASLAIGQVTTAILVGTFRTSRGDLVTVHSQARFASEKVSANIALTVVRSVCGEGLTLTSLGRGRAYERNRAALALGLDVADEVLDGRGGSTRP